MEAQRSGWPWSSARHWMDGAGLERREEQGRPRSPHLLLQGSVISFRPPPYSCASLLVAKPPSGGVSMGRGHGKQPSGGRGSRVGNTWAGGPLVERGGAGPRSSSQCSLLSYTGGVGGTGGPQAESPPPELFFLGRVFSVLEATGYGERMMGLSLAPRRCRPHPPPPPQATACSLTSALGTFLIVLVLLVALSPRSSSEVSVRSSAWLVLDLTLRAGSSPS